MPQTFPLTVPQIRATPEQLWQWQDARRSGGGAGRRPTAERRRSWRGFAGWTACGTHHGGVVVGRKELARRLAQEGDAGCCHSAASLSVSCWAGQLRAAEDRRPRHLGCRNCAWGACTGQHGVLRCAWRGPSAPQGRSLARSRLSHTASRSLDAVSTRLGRLNALAAAMEVDVSGACSWWPSCRSQRRCILCTSSSAAAASRRRTPTGSRRCLAQRTRRRCPQRQPPARRRMAARCAAGLGRARGCRRRRRSLPPLGPSLTALPCPASTGGEAPQQPRPQPQP